MGMRGPTGRCAGRESVCVKLTTNQAAEALAEALAVDGREPRVHQLKIKTLALAGALTDVSQTTRVMIELDQLMDFARRTRYVYDVEELLAAAPMIYRVSVLERTPNLAYSEDGKLLRRFAGVDFRDPPTSANELGGWEGVWPISQKNATALVESRGTVLASCRGYIAPGHWRTVRSASKSGSRRYFHTTPASRTIAKLVGSGLWIDIPDGPVSDFLKPIPAPER